MKTCSRCGVADGSVGLFNSPVDPEHAEIEECITTLRAKLADAEKTSALATLEGIRQVEKYIALEKRCMDAEKAVWMITRLRQFAEEPCKYPEKARGIDPFCGECTSCVSGQVLIRLESLHKVKVV